MKILILTLVLMISLLIWGFAIEPNILTVKHITIKDARLKGLKVVFASDFHIKHYEMHRLKRIVRAINKQDADLILLGGDYVNGHKKIASLPIYKIAGEFSKMQSKYGTIGVIGNHDGWQGRDEVIEELEKNGIKVLVNDNTCFENFCIAGVDDIQTGKPDVAKSLLNADKPTIVVAHNPDILFDVPYDVVLTLAGHLHGGQIRLHTALVSPSIYGNRYINGYTEDRGKKIFTSYGLGNSILPIRFNCPPEIAVITFED